MSEIDKLTVQIASLGDQLSRKENKIRLLTAMIESLREKLDLLESQLEETDKIMLEQNLIIKTVRELTQDCEANGDYSILVKGINELLKGE